MSNEADNIYGTTTVLKMENEFEKAFEHLQKDRDLADRNWGAYTGFDYGQWQKSAVGELKAQNRHIAQYNFIRGKIDSLAGSITRTDLELDFVPIEQSETELTRALKSLFISDKELLNWNQEFMQATTDGLVYQGVLEMVISDRYSALGNIGLERIQPGNIVIDPNWKSHKSVDLKKAWKVSYMTPEQLKIHFDTDGARIESLIQNNITMGMVYENDIASRSMQHKTLSSIYGSLYRIIEMHYIKEIRKTVDIVISDDLKIEIPPDLSDADFKEFMSSNNLQKSDIIRQKIVVNEYWVKTACAQLSRFEFIEDKKATIQIGRLPFFPWSSGRINGVDSGLVDLMIDAQQTINKRESLIDHMMATSAHGAMFIDPAIVGGDENKMRDIIKDIDKPNMKVTTAPGALASGRNYTQLLTKNSYEGEIYQDISRMTDNLDKLSRQTATLSGMNEGAHETGILFARKQMQGEIALTTLMAGVNQLWNDLGEAYLLLAKDLYSNVYREFRIHFDDTNNNEMLFLNMPVETEDGTFIVNDFSKLQRHKVIVSEAPTSITLRTTERAINAELLQTIPQEAQLSRAQITKNIVETLNMSDSDKERMREANDLEYQLAEIRMRAEIVQIEAQVQQTQAQTAQMEMQTAAGATQMDGDMAAAEAELAEGEGEAPVEEEEAPIQ